MELKASMFPDGFPECVLLPTCLRARGKAVKAKVVLGTGVKWLLARRTNEEIDESYKLVFLLMCSLFMLYRSLETRTSFDITEPFLI